MAARVRPGWRCACLAILVLAGCSERPAYQPYYIVVPYPPGADPKASEDAARAVIERLRQSQGVEAPAPAPSIQAVPQVEPIPFTDQPDQDPQTR